MQVEIEREEDGRWIAEVPALPGVLVYGATAEEARVKARTLALQVIADRIGADAAKPEDMLWFLDNAGMEPPVSGDEIT